MLMIYASHFCVTFPPNTGHILYEKYANLLNLIKNFEFDIIFQNIALDDC